MSGFLKMLYACVCVCVCVCVCIYVYMYGCMCTCACMLCIYIYVCFVFTPFFTPFVVCSHSAHYLPDFVLHGTSQSYGTFKEELMGDLTNVIKVCVNMYEHAPVCVCTCVCVYIYMCVYVHLCVYIIYGTVSSKITLVDSFSSFQIFSFSVNAEDLLSNGPYTSLIGLSIII